jgi:septal ring-binding cell division protein DamX
MKLWSACVAVGLLVGGCAGQSARPPTTEVTRIPEQGDWFCQLSPSGEGWHCVQDPKLAKQPVPQRLPEPAAPPEAAPEPLPLPEPEPPPQRREEPPAPLEQTDTARPEYVRLAYQPPEAVPLTQLPREFYAAQVLAMSTREALEAFVQRHGIEGASAARVERDGEIYYVLLLGIYETAEIARRAVTDLPRPFHDIEPWIRPLGALQSAMARADALAGSAGF